MPINIKQLQQNQRISPRNPLEINSTSEARIRGSSIEQFGDAAAGLGEKYGRFQLAAAEGEQRVRLRKVQEEMQTEALRRVDYIDQNGSKDGKGDDPLYSDYMNEKKKEILSRDEFRDLDKRDMEELSTGALGVQNTYLAHVLGDAQKKRASNALLEYKNAEEGQLQATYNNPGSYLLNVNKGLVDLKLKVDTKVIPEKEYPAMAEGLKKDFANMSISGYVDRDMFDSARRDIKQGKYKDALTADEIKTHMNYIDQKEMEKITRDYSVAEQTRLKKERDKKDGQLREYYKLLPEAVAVSKGTAIKRRDGSIASWSGPNPGAVAAFEKKITALLPAQGVTGTQYASLLTTLKDGALKIDEESNYEMASRLTEDFSPENIDKLQGSLRLKVLNGKSMPKSGEKWENIFRGILSRQASDPTYAKRVQAGMLQIDSILGSKEFLERLSAVVGGDAANERLRTSNHVKSLYIDFMAQNPNANGRQVALGFLKVYASRVDQTPASPLSSITTLRMKAPIGEGKATPDFYATMKDLRDEMDKLQRAKRGGSISEEDYRTSVLNVYDKMNRLKNHATNEGIDTQLEMDKMILQNETRHPLFKEEEPQVPYAPGGE